MPRHDRPERSPLAAHWPLDPGVVYLNHGSFGATPAAVLERQSALRQLLEAEPVRFLARELEGRLDDARTALAFFVAADPDDLAFVHNATSGVNAVLGSLSIRSGDEILTTTHEYNACRNVLERYAERAGARVVAARVPFPVRGQDEVVEAVVAAATPRTRLALVDHVTSATGLVLPLERIARELADRGIPVLGDGAHAPGMIDLDLRALGDAGVHWYVANCHKWVCSPKGSGFLWVRRDAQGTVRPAVTSHGANTVRPDRSRFHLEFDWQGTQDPTAWLCIPDAIAFVGELVPGGWPEVRERNRRLALDGRDVIAGALGVEPPAPDTMIGALAAIPIGPSLSADPDPLQTLLFERHAIEVPVYSWPDPALRILRISAQLYNTPAEYAYLAHALRE